MTSETELQFDFKSLIDSSIYGTGIITIKKHTDDEDNKTLSALINLKYNIRSPYAGGKSVTHKLTGYTTVEGTDTKRALFATPFNSTDPQLSISITLSTFATVYYNATSPVDCGLIKLQKNVKAIREAIWES